MRVSHFAFLLLALSVVQNSQAQDTLAFQSHLKETILQGNASLRELPQTAFKEGERLVFDVGYSFITAGEAVMSVPKMDTLFGRPTFQVRVVVVAPPQSNMLTY